MGEKHVFTLIFVSRHFFLVQMGMKQFDGELFRQHEIDEMRHIEAETKKERKWV